MGRPCPICCHPKKLQIDREIIAGTALLKISRKYSVGYDGLYQHSKKHLSRQLVQAYEKKALSESMDLLSMIEDILIKAKAIFDRNYEAKKDLTALKALSEQRATIELLSKIAAYLHESRAMELQTTAKGYEEKRQEEEREMTSALLDNLNSAESDMFVRLLEKGQGQRNEEIIPIKVSIWEDDQEQEQESFTVGQSEFDDTDEDGPPVEKLPTPKGRQKKKPSLSLKGDTRQYKVQPIKPLKIPHR